MYGCLAERYRYAAVSLLTDFGTWLYGLDNNCSF